MEVAQRNVRSDRQGSGQRGVGGLHRGALATTLDGVAVGPLCDGSLQATVANQIEHVRSLLRVEVASSWE